MKAASPETIRLVEFGDAVRKGSVTSSNDFLGRLVTLDTALIGGAVAVGSAKVMPWWACATTAVLLLASLVVCLNALRPRKAKMDFSSVDALAELERTTIERKDFALKCGGIVFVSALAAAILGLVVKSLS